MTESLKKLQKSKISEAILREEKAEQLDKLKEAFDKIEEHYISDVMALTEENEKLAVNSSSLTEKDEKIKSLEKELEDAKKANTKYQEENNEFNTKIGGLESNIKDKDLELKKVKESGEEAIKEMRVQIVAKITGLKLDENMTKLLKECKSDEDLLEKLEEYRTKLAEAVLHSNIVKTVEIKENAPKQTEKQASLKKFADRVESLM